MSNRLLVAVVMGGPSKEHEVSLSSGKAMAEALNRDKYQIIKVLINKRGGWQIEDAEDILSAGTALTELKHMGVNVVVLALHGTFGEDGTIQALLEHRGIAFTGSPSVSSLLAMDKLVSETLYEDAGLTVPRSLPFNREDSNIASEISESRMGYPLVIKPVRQGSSVGVHIVREESELMPAFNDAVQYDQRVMVQEMIVGREVSCGVLERPESGEAYALPPTELIPQDAEFFDYDSKYIAGRTLEITPPDMPQNLIKLIQAKALAAHILLGCKGYSRTDIIMQGDIPYIIETNTLPGMTPTSILPQQAQHAGMSMTELLDQIIARAL